MLIKASPSSDQITIEGKVIYTKTFKSLRGRVADIAKQLQAVKTELSQHFSGDLDNARK